MLLALRSWRLPAARRALAAGASSLSAAAAPFSSAAAAAAASALIAARPPPARPRRAAATNLLLALKDALLAEKDARIAAAERELRERIAAAERELRERIAAAERELHGKDALLAEVRTSSSREVALAKHAADIAKGVLNARGLFEACLADIASAASSGSSSSFPSSPSAQLRRLLGGGGGGGGGGGSSSGSAAPGAQPSPCPGLVAYLRRAAADNGVPEREMLTQAGRLYEVLSERLHSDAASGAGTTHLPVEMFERPGRTTMVALAAFVRFTGRDIALYNATGAVASLRLRLPPPAACTATVEALATAPFS